MGNSKWRVLDKCHQLRNLAEYEGVTEVDTQLLKELIMITRELLGLIEAVGPIK